MEGNLAWLDDEAYCTIGRFAASFGALEHSILAAIHKLDPTSPLPEKVIEGTFATRIQHLEKVAKRVGASDGWLSDFIAKSNEGLSARNHFSHGLWEKSDGKLKCSFYKRNNERNPVVWQGSLSDLVKLAQSNIENVKALKTWIDSKCP